MVATAVNARVKGWGRIAAWVVVTAALAFSPALGLGASEVRQLILILMLAMIVSGVNLSFGYAGELSFAQAAMYATGAYLTATLSVHWVNDLLLTLVISACGGMVLGLIAGIPSMRLGGWMLAITSLYVVLIVPDVVTIFRTWTGGHSGLTGIPIAQLFGHELSDDEYLVAIVVVASAWFAVFRNLIASRAGTTFAVLRQSPILASSLGISVPATKFKTYALSGLPAAMAGTFFAYLDGFVTPASFGVGYAIVLLAASILGGSRSVYGALVGAAIMQLGPLQSSTFGEYAFVAYGIFLIVAGVLFQRGITGLVRRGAERIRARRRTGRDEEAHAPGEVVLPPMRGRALVVDGVDKRFGGNQVLQDVSLTVPPGEVVALIGPNGSGKTTLLNLISGYYRADNGAIRLGEQEITSMPPHVVARAGVSRTFQTPLIPSMTVRQVVESARTNVTPVSVVETMLRLPRYRQAVRRDREAVDGLLAAVGLAHLADEDAGSLPLGTRRLLELARALAADPSIVLLDEVASGLDDDEIIGLSRVVDAARRSGASVLLVEHNFALVRSLADQVVVLSRGSVVVQAAPDVVATHPEVLEHYLGGPVGAATTKAVASDG
ncbi:ATP-binding cassette domain-containing protein [Amycolatopsis sp. NPDC006131]|uniref:branched-chain amino acid ABC transporter ATP-binding protein/permease n=1 Tax=Amycolatopsis sp. NPDC006131 TaxID=3156731 RepID=UPI0033A77D8F